MEFGSHIGKTLSTSLTLILVSIASAQARSGAPATAPTAKAASLIDITPRWKILSISPSHFLVHHTTRNRQTLRAGIPPHVRPGRHGGG